MYFVQIKVSSDEGPFSLQTAIDAAEPGDTVLLAPGMVSGGGVTKGMHRNTHGKRGKRNRKQTLQALIRSLLYKLLWRTNRHSVGA